MALHAWDKGVFKTLDRAFIKFLCFSLWLYKKLRVHWDSKSIKTLPSVAWRTFKKLVFMGTVVRYIICYKICSVKNSYSPMELHYVLKYRLMNSFFLFLCMHTQVHGCVYVYGFACMSVHMFVKGATAHPQVLLFLQFIIPLFLETLVWGGHPDFYKNVSWASHEEPTSTVLL